MVTRIQKKEYDAWQARRGYSETQKSLGFLIWQGPDGKYYKNEVSGTSGLKEMIDYNKQLKSDMAARAIMIDTQVKLV
jgi:hypothetical protein